MSGSGIVDVIAEALAGHAFTEIEHGYWYCECGAELGVLLPDDLHAAHQARAVLDALTEAGTVEWGLLHGDRPRVERCFTQGYAKQCAAESESTLVSRLTLPWTAAE